MSRVDEHHRPRELHMERHSQTRCVRAAAVTPHSRGIEERARVGEAQADEDGRQAELLEAEDGRQTPDSCRHDTRTIVPRGARYGRAISGALRRSSHTAMPGRQIAIR